VGDAWHRGREVPPHGSDVCAGGRAAECGIPAVSGGAALVAVPTGRLLSANPYVLARTAFSDFPVPGILLAVCVGGGAAGGCADRAAATSLASGGHRYVVGVLILEVTELRLIGWQPMQGVVGALAVLMLSLVLANGRSGVAIAPNGRAGLEKQKNPALDIVLLDIGLPFVDGWLRNPNRSGSP
jgi:hypothetical protein